MDLSLSYFIMFLVSSINSFLINVWDIQLQVARVALEDKRRGGLSGKDSPSLVSLLLTYLLFAAGSWEQHLQRDDWWGTCLSSISAQFLHSWTGSSPDPPWSHGWKELNHHNFLFLLYPAAGDKTLLRGCDQGERAGLRHGWKFLAGSETRVFVPHAPLCGWGDVPVSSSKALQHKPTLSGKWDVFSHKKKWISNMTLGVNFAFEDEVTSLVQSKSEGQAVPWAVLLKSAI